MIIVVMLCSSGFPAIAQDDTRSAGLRVAALTVTDGGFAKNMNVRLDVHAEQGEVSFREGVLEGLLEAGLVVLDEDGGREADLQLSFISRGMISGDLKVSVVGMDQVRGEYLFSRAYMIPLEEETVLETLLAPAVVITSAILVVYLLLTVRSS